MFKRPHHRLVEQVLKIFDADVLHRARCYFAGGTAIVLALDEYRESLDIDFLCAGAQNWRALRDAVTPPTLGALVKVPPEYARETRTQRDKIVTRINAGGFPIRVEFVLEGRLEKLHGSVNHRLGVPVLSREDLFAEKLLANTDRGNDRSTMSRDLIDLGMMIQRWGPIPRQAWQAVLHVYGDAALHAFKKNQKILADTEYALACARSMRMDVALLPDISAALKRRDCLPPSPRKSPQKLSP